MDNACASFLIILRLFDEHWLEAGHRREDCTTQPRAMLSIGGRVNLRRHVRWSQRLHFFLHALLHTLKHSATASKYDVFEQVPPDVFLTLNDCLVGMLMDSIRTFIHLLPPLTRIEEDLRALKRLFVDGDGLGAGQFILLRRCRLVG